MNSLPRPMPSLLALTSPPWTSVRPFTTASPTPKPVPSLPPGLQHLEDRRQPFARDAAAGVTHANHDARRLLFERQMNLAGRFGELHGAPVPPPTGPPTTKASRTESRGRGGGATRRFGEWASAELLTARPPIGVLNAELRRSGDPSMSSPTARRADEPTIVTFVAYIMRETRFQPPAPRGCALRATGVPVARASSAVSPAVLCEHDRSADRPAPGIRTLRAVTGAPRHYDHAALRSFPSGR